MFQRQHATPGDVGTADLICQVCDRPRPDDRMTESGICTDCLPQQHRPVPAIGPGRLAVRRQLDGYRTKKREKDT
jgi:hypothetical protein